MSFTSRPRARLKLSLPSRRMLVTFPPVFLLSSSNPTEESTRLRLLNDSYPGPLASTLSASVDDTATSYIHSPSLPTPSPLIDRRRLTMRFFTAREGCEGFGVPIPVPDRAVVAAMVVVASLAFVLDADSTRLLRGGGGGDSTCGSVVPKTKPEKVALLGDPHERAALSLLPLGLVLVLALVLLPPGAEESSERNVSWLAARTSRTLAAQSSRSYNLCSNNLNVNG